MSIRNMLGRGRVNLHLLGFLAGIGGGAAISQGCVNPEGTRVWIEPPADGIVTKAERRERVELTADMGTRIYDDNLILREHLSDEDVAMKNRWSTRGMNWAPLGNMHLHASEDATELADHYDYCTRGKEMPDGFGAFYCEENDTSYQIAAPLVLLIDTFYHERGHKHNTMNWDNMMAEIPSESMRIYMCVARRGIDRELGTMLGRFCFSQNIPQDNVIEGASDIKRKDGLINQYEAGVLTFLGVANDHNGDLDMAYRTIRNASSSKLKELFNGVVDRHPDSTAREMWFNEIEDLLDSEGFMNYLNSLNLEVKGKRTEAQELRDYFRIMAKDSQFRVTNGEQQDTSQIVLERRYMMEDMVDEGDANGWINPRFRNRIVKDLSKIYISEIDDYMSDNTPEGYTDAEELADKVIKMNKDYPCEYDTFACSESYAGIRPEHLQAYEKGMRASFMRDNREKTLKTADAFIKKFYPNGNFNDLSRGTQLRETLVRILKQGYYYSIVFSSRASVEGDNDKRSKFQCKALEYLRLFEDAGCGNIEDEDTRNECYADTSSLAFENDLQDKIDNIEEYYGAYCISQ